MGGDVEGAPRPEAGREGEVVSWVYRNGKLHREVVPPGFGEAQLPLPTSPDGLDLTCRACVLEQEAHLHGAKLYEAGRWLF